MSQTIRCPSVPSRGLGIDSHVVRGASNRAELRGTKRIGNQTRRTATGACDAATVRSLPPVVQVSPRSHHRHSMMVDAVSRCIFIDGEIRQPATPFPPGERSPSNHRRCRPGSTRTDGMPGTEADEPSLTGTVPNHRRLVSAAEEWGCLINAVDIAWLGTTRRERPFAQAMPRMVCRDAPSSPLIRRVCAVTDVDRPDSRRLMPNNLNRPDPPLPRQAAARQARGKRLRDNDRTASMRRVESRVRP